ncbi:helix-turn-helix transcriptional regulator [Brevundimonas sp.]|uniref:helix-turn-helix domain-containing protein n=1 Tax=Brevundimonas sp. TaxID=1871086 RepID=UPI002ED9AB43
MTAGEEEDRRRTRHIDVPLGARLRLIRENRGLSQADMARMLDISTNQWGRHESGANRVPAARLWQFCEALNIDVAAVFRDQPFAAAKGVSAAVVETGPHTLRGMEAPGAVWSDTADQASPQEGRGTLVQRIGAAARDLSEARQRTALAVIRALKTEDDG